MKVKIESFGYIGAIGEEDTWNCIDQNLPPNWQSSIVHSTNKVVAPITIPCNSIDNRAFRRMDKQIIFELVAGEICAGKYDFNGIDKKRVGIFTGSLFAQLGFGMTQIRSLIESKEKNEISMYTGISFYYGAASGEVSLLLKSQGENAVICSGACSGTDCIIAGASNIHRGINDFVFAISGENLEESIINFMLPNTDDKNSMFIPNKYFYSGGAMAVLLANDKFSTSQLEIVASVSGNSSKSLFCIQEIDFKDKLKSLICACVNKAGIKIEEIDIVIPGLNNTGKSDLCELEVLQELLVYKKGIVYNPIPLLGDMLSASGILKVYVASCCLKEKVLPSNNIGFYEEKYISKYKSLFNWERRKLFQMQYALIIQKDIIGGRINVILIKNNENGNI